MKKALFIVFLATIAIASQAQFGVKAGLNIATLGGDDADFDGKKSLLWSLWRRVL